MGWIVVITLLVFYALGIWVFHATGPVRVLPLIALLVLIIDRFFIHKYKSN